MRLSLDNPTRAAETIEELYSDAVRLVNSNQPGLCPVDLSLAFLRLAHAQSCGKCTPCRVGLLRLEELIRGVLVGDGDENTIDLIESTAQTVFVSSDCVIGQEAARTILKAVKGFRDEFESHLKHSRCISKQNLPVPCVAGCPAHVDIPGYVALIPDGRYSDAVDLIRRDNPFPSVCGLICEHPCEEHCRRARVDDAINIRGLKRYAVEHEGDIKIPEKSAPTGKRVAVIGGGPSGLTCAYYLSIMGHDVTVYEQRKHAGGMLRYGIPNYRLPRKLLDAEIESMKRTGFTLLTETSVGSDVPFEKIKSDYDAVYVAIGSHMDRKLGLEGEDATGVVSAVELLRGIGDGEYPDYTGLDVVVVGGGNVAMDVARSAIRLGASTVTIAYRRRKTDMTALEEEVEGAIADGCEILEMHAPTRIEKKEDGSVAAIYVQPQIVGPVKWGRPAPVKADAQEKRLKCDLVLVAVGQLTDAGSLDEELPTSRSSVAAGLDLRVDGLDGVFAGGDCMTGPATVIKAIAAGKTAAANIDEYLGFEHKISSDITPPTAYFTDHEPHGRVNMTERPAEERSKDFDLMEYCMSDEEASQESSRCLRCDCYGYGCFRGGRNEKW